MYIDELRISNSVRYSAAFTPARRFVNDAQTTLLYHLDEIAGAELVDSSGNNYTGQLMGGVHEIDDGYNASMCQ